jgi:anti-anti-sigma regulatory factor
MTLDVAAAGHLALDGALTIRTAEAVSAKLLDAIREHTCLSIDCSAAPEIDLSFIQLLIAARASALLSHRSVILATRPDGVLLDTLTRGGFRVTQEDQEDKAATFWFDGAPA